MGCGMNRFDDLRRFADKEKTGMEIAPYFAPIAAKADGYKILVADILDQDALRKSAKVDPNISDDHIANIEPVDIVADACKLGEAAKTQGFAGTIDYILSSHNFEHLPDPISFLRGCEVALAPGGTLTMAIPDCRATFDHFRMPTRLADWLEAYHRERSQPSPETVFDTQSNFALYYGPDMEPTSFSGADSPVEGFRPVQELKAAYDRYVSELTAPGPYSDAHCHLVFGESFELMVRDLRHLGLIDLEIIEVSPTNGIEFFAYLRKPLTPNTQQEDEAAFYERRLELMRKVNRALGPNGLEATRSEKSGRALARKVFGDGFIEKVRNANRRRRQRRKARR